MREQHQATENDQMTSAKQRLAAAIRKARPNGSLEAMAKRAEKGHYDDFESPLAAPITQLVMELKAAGEDDLAKRAMEGEFDAE